MYIEPHHPDIMAVLELKRNSGDEHLRARDLFYAVYASDLFMRRVEANAKWSLFDPSTAPGLADVWGKEYEDLYEKYEAEGRAVRVVQAQDVWFETLRSQASFALARSPVCVRVCVCVSVSVCEYFTRVSVCFSGRDWHAVHRPQGPREREEQPAKPRHHQDE